MHGLNSPPTAALDSWAALVEQIRTGGRDAEEELVARFGDGLALMLRRLTGDPALADDLRQETLRIVLEKLRAGALREPEKLPGFLRGTARNLVLAARRRDARLRFDGDGLALEAALHAPAETEPLQLRRILRREEAHLVRTLLGELRFERDRQVLTHFYLTERTKDEICRELEIDPHGFKKVLFRARERLRDLWQRAEKRQRLAETSS
ncbi:MAG: sigma-70 family RNA polymerase sigma factor [Acidobacteriota bacterium]